MLKPVETYAVNVMGTVNLLEVARHVASVKAVIIVTSDKCYDNFEEAVDSANTTRLAVTIPTATAKAAPN